MFMLGGAVGRVDPCEMASYMRMCTGSGCARLFIPAWPPTTFTPYEWRIFFFHFFHAVQGLSIRGWYVSRLSPRKKIDEMLRLTFLSLSFTGDTSKSWLPITLQTDS